MYYRFTYKSSDKDWQWEGVYIMGLGIMSKALWDEGQKEGYPMGYQLATLDDNKILLYVSPQDGLNDVGKFFADMKDTDLPGGRVVKYLIENLTIKGQEINKDKNVKDEKIGVTFTIPSEIPGYPYEEELSTQSGKIATITYGLFFGAVSKYPFLPRDGYYVDNVRIMIPGSKFYKIDFKDYCNTSKNDEIDNTDTCTYEKTNNGFEYIKLISKILVIGTNETKKWYSISSKIQILILKLLLYLRKYLIKKQPKKLSNNLIK